MTSTYSTKRTGSDGLLFGLALGGVSSALAISYVPALRNGRVDGHGGCLFRRLTGCKCPFCGMTHAVVSLAHGHLLTAARQDAIVFLLLLACVAAFANRCVAGRRLMMWFRGRAPTVNPKGAFVMALVYSALRDL